MKSDNKKRLLRLLMIVFIIAGLVSFFVGISEKILDKNMKTCDITNCNDDGASCTKLYEQPDSYDKKIPNCTDKSCLGLTGGNYICMKDLKTNISNPKTYNTCVKETGYKCSIERRSPAAMWTGVVLMSVGGIVLFVWSIARLKKGLTLSYKDWR